MTTFHRLLACTLLAGTAVLADPDGSRFDPADYPVIGSLVATNGEAIVFINNAGKQSYTVDGTSFNGGIRVTNESGRVIMAMYNFDQLHIDSSASVTVNGALGLVLGSQGNLMIDTPIALNGTAGSQSTAGVGGAGAEGGTRNSTSANFNSAPPPTNAGNGGNDAGGSTNHNDTRGRGYGAAHDVAGNGRGSGGGYGGRGGGITVDEGYAYGSPDLAELFGGSGGGGSQASENLRDAAGGGGGGSIELTALGNLVIGPSARIRTNGGNGGTPGGGTGTLAGGGGSGGGILISAPVVELHAGARIEAKGGNGGNSAVDGGRGGGGRIAIYADQLTQDGTLDVSRGSFGQIGRAANGTIFHGEYIFTLGPRIELLPESHDFDRVRVGSSTNASFTVSNPGTETLSITNLLIGGVDAAPFSVTPPPPIVLTTGSTTMITVSYAPVDESAHSNAWLSLHTDAVNGSLLEIPLSGEGALPHLAITNPVPPAALDFGNALTNATTFEEFVSVTNTGRYPLVITNLSFSGTHTNEFAHAAVPIVVDPESSVAIGITFTPQALGLREAVLDVYSDDPAAPLVTVNVRGTGEGPTRILEISPAQFDFGFVRTNTTRDILFVARNRGNSLLDGSALPTNGLFSISSGSPFSIPAGGSEVISLRFTPTALGSATGTVSFTSNGGSSNVTLSGTGTMDAGPQAEFYVDPVAGLDTYPGTIAEPFQSIEKARDTVRTINASMGGDIIVYLRGGIYERTEPLLFDTRDSGANGFQVIYRNYSNEEPIIEGGVPITGWTHWQDGIYTADVGSLEFMQLYVNNRPATRARYPDSRGFRIHSQQNPDILIPNNQAQNWSNLNRVEIVMAAAFSSSRMRIGSIDFSGAQDRVRPMEPERHAHFWGLERPSYYFENHLDFLNQPGEWFLDVDSDTVYYMPLPGEGLANAQVIAPRTEQLLNIEDTRNLTLFGITFQHTHWQEPLDRGMVQRQAGMRIQARQNNQGNWVQDSFVINPVATYFKGIRNLTIERCIFRQMGSCAMGFDTGCKNNTVIGNVFAEIADTAIIYDMDNDPNVNGNLNSLDRIDSNYFLRMGMQHLAGAGIFAFWPDRLTITRNEIAVASGFGINVGWGATYATTALRAPQVTRNRIHDVAVFTRDSGGVHTKSDSNGGLYSRNWIYNSQPRSWWHTGKTPREAYGIYLDDNTENTRVKENVFNNIDGANVHDKGRNNTITANDSQNQGYKEDSGLRNKYADIKAFWRGGALGRDLEPGGTYVDPGTTLPVLFDDTFDADPIGSLPPPYQANTNNGTVAVVDLGDGNQGLRMHDTGTSGPQLTRHLPVLTGHIAITCRVRPNKANASWQIYLYDSDDRVAARVGFTSNGELRYWYEDALPVRMKDYDANDWQKLRIEIDTEKRVYSVWINGTTRITDTQFLEDATDLSRLFVDTGSNTGLFDIDYLRVELLDAPDRTRFGGLSMRDADDTTAHLQATAYPFINSTVFGTGVYEPGGITNLLAIGSGTGDSAAFELHHVRTGLTPATYYQFRTWSSNQTEGLLWSDEEGMLLTEPEAVSDLEVTVLPDAALQISWVEGSPHTHSLVVVRERQAPSAAPADRRRYTASPRLGAGAASKLGGGQVVHAGPGTRVTVTGRTPEDLYIAVYAYADERGLVNYQQDAAPLTVALDRQVELDFNGSFEDDLTTLAPDTQSPFWGQTAPNLSRWTVVRNTGNPSLANGGASPPFSAGNGDTAPYRSPTHGDTFLLFGGADLVLTQVIPNLVPGQLKLAFDLIYFHTTQERNTTARVELFAGNTTAAPLIYDSGIIQVYDQPDEAWRTYSSDWLSTASTELFIRLHLSSLPGAYALGGLDNIHLSLIPEEDSDADGIADAWELNHWGNLTQANASSHSDADPLSDLEEYISGTDPSNDRSFFIIEQVTGGQDAALYFESQPNRRYTLQYKEQIHDPIWLNVPGEMQRLGLGGNDVMLDPNPLPKRYYRIKTTLP